MTKNIFKKAGLIATVAAATFGAAAHADDADKAKEEKIATVKVSEDFSKIFADKDGNFDKKGVEEAFDTLNYKEKVPEILKIFENAKENGFSETEKAQVLGLFNLDGNEQAGKAMDAAMKDMEKTLDKGQPMIDIAKNILGVGIAFSLTCAVAMEFMRRKKSVFNRSFNVPDDFTAFESAKEFIFPVFATGALLLMEGPVDGLKDTIKDPVKMRDFVVKSAEKAFEQNAQAGRQVFEMTPAQEQALKASLTRDMGK